MRTKPVPLLLQHGAWHGAWCWDNWLTHFSGLGYEVHAISLPGHGLSPLGKSHINRYTLGDYAEILAEVVDGITPRPAVIGHSMGGAILQRLLERQPLPAAVLLATLPRRGIAPYLLRSLRNDPAVMMKTIGTLNTYHPVGSAERVAENFFSADTDVDCVAWERQMVRESFGMVVSSLLPIANAEKVRRSPVLVVAGGQDAVFTVAEEQATANAYGADMLLFDDQAHNLMAEPRSGEIADAVDQWLTKTLA